MSNGHLLHRLGAFLATWRRNRRVEEPRLAVLIDGDGVSPRDAERVLDFLTSHGKLVVLRIYANFNSTSERNWTNFVRQHGGVGRHLPNLASGKNGSDIALAVEAMDLLRLRKLDTIVLVASDSDFTPLAIRIRETGREVLGFGHKTSPEPYRRACTAFHDLRLHSPSPMVTEPQEALWSRQPADAETLVLRALADLGDNDAPVPLSSLGVQLRHIQPGFDCRVYSRSKLGDLLLALPSVRLVKVNGRAFAQRSRLSP